MDWRDILDDPDLAEFEAVEDGPARLLVRREHRDSARLLGLGGVPEAAWGSVAGGRQDHPVVELADGTLAVVRRYRRGGFIRHFNRDRYLGGHRSFRELRVTEHSRRAGVRVPRVLAAGERRERIGYTATLATEWIPDARELSGWIQDAGEAERRGVLAEAGSQIGKMHAAGVGHPDLNLRNLLVQRRDGDRARRAWLLDFDRARIFPGGVTLQRRAREIRRLERSARKLGVELAPADWAALARGYGSEWPFAVPAG